MNLVEFLLTIQNQLKIFHWQTESFAQHKALDKAYEKLLELGDDFLETYMGKYGRPKAKDKFEISLENYSDSYKDVIRSYVKILVNDFPKALKETDTDLLNIRDEMLGTLNRLLYLLSLE
jgi:hypothetical protein